MENPETLATLGTQNTGLSGADPGFQVRGGAHLKKLRRAQGYAVIFGVFRVKNHDFTPKNHIFSNFRGGVLLVHTPPGSTPGYDKKKITHTTQKTKKV